MSPQPAPSPSPADQRADRVLQTLDRVSRFVGSVMDLKQLLRHVMEESEQLLGAEASSVWIYDDVTDELYFEVVLGEADVIERIRHMRLKVSEGQGFAGQCARDRRPIRVHDAQADERHFRGVDEQSSFVTRSLLALPLVCQDKLIGVLQILNRREGGAFDEDDLRVMEIIANTAAIAIENARLIEANIRSERLAAMGTAISGISHSIKNILTGVRGGSSLIEHALSQDPPAVDIIQETWPILRRNEGRISELIQDMLLYSKPRDPDLEDASTADLCREIHDLSLERANLAGVALEIDLPSDDPLETAVDTSAMHDCILNLVTNAIEATPSGDESRVCLSAERAEEGEAILIRVADNGTGIPEPVLKKIWEPFFSTKGKKGTGLGLAMTRKTVEEHGGQIAAVSHEGEGTTFTISLPVQTAAEALREAPKGESELSGMDE